MHWCGRRIRFDGVASRLTCIVSYCIDLLRRVKTVVNEINNVSK